MAEYIIDLLQKFSWVLVGVILIFGWFSPAIMVLTFICMVAPIVFSFKYGRAWCGNFCPRSSFNNSILAILCSRGKLPKVLKSDAFRIMIFILLMTFFIFNLYLSHGSLIGIGRAFLKMMLITTIIQVTFGILVHPNAWCMFCPMGTAAYYITRFNLKEQPNIKISKDCSACGVCKEKCPVQIDIPAQLFHGEVMDADCIKCRKCIKSCPRNALKWG